SNGYGAQGVSVAGTLVYLASPNVNRQAGNGGLYMIDATIPTAPRLLAHSLGGLENQGVAVGGSLAVAVGTGNGIGMTVVDVSTPSTPRAIGSLPGWMGGVAMAGQSVAYVRVGVAGNPSHNDL